MRAAMVRDWRAMVAWASPACCEGAQAANNSAVEANSRVNSLAMTTSWHVRHALDRSTVDS